MAEKEVAEKEKFIKWFSELDKGSVSIVGGKGANLGEIYNLKIPVPPGFVVTTKAYDYFIEQSGLKAEISELLGNIDYDNTAKLNENSKKIRNLIIKAEIPKNLIEEIEEAYENLGVEDPKHEEEDVLGILDKNPEDVFVAVRSSATTEDLADASFAGQQDTFLNVNGKEELLEKVKRCFASLFTSRATYYRHKKGFEHEKSGLAVVVQRMVNSEKSGVIFSKDPSFKNDNIIIEAVYGLGEGIVSGKITPDHYVVSKDFEILKKEIADKKIAIVKNDEGKKEEVSLSEDKSNSVVLSEFELHKLAEIALKLENHYDKPQDIEFAIEGEDIYIVQTRAITTMEKRVEEGSGGEISGEVILKGVGASPGIASGKIKIVHDLSELEKVNKGDVLVTKMTNPDMVVTMQKSAAIVTDDGGLTAHAAIVSREMGIPCIVGTKNATTKLKDGEVITVDGSSGKVYKGKVAETQKKEVRPVQAKTKTKIKVIVDLPTYAERAAKTGLKGVGLTRVEGIIAESGKHPNYFLENDKEKDYEEVIYKGISDIAKHFEELWIRTSDVRSDEFSNLEGAPESKEANPMLGFHGIRFGLKNPKVLKAELNALKRVSEEDKTIGLLLPQIISVEEVQGVKEVLKEIGFTKARVGVMVETPASVQIIDKLCEEGIDFISFGTNDLTQYTLAVDRGNEKVQELYEETNLAVLRQIEHVIKICKEHEVETSICGQAGSRREMVKFLVKNKIDSISVNADVASDIAEYVSGLEEGQVSTEGSSAEEVSERAKEEQEKQPERKPEENETEGEETSEKESENIEESSEKENENISEQKESSDGEGDEKVEGNENDSENVKNNGEESEEKDYDENDFSNGIAEDNKKSDSNFSQENDEGNKKEEGDILDIF